MKSGTNEGHNPKAIGGVFVLALTSLLLPVLMPAQAKAENWELKATIPLESNLIEAVSNNGTVGLTYGNRAYRWTQSGGKQQIAASADVQCSVDIAGITDEDVILGTRSCYSGNIGTNKLLAWTPDSGDNPIEPIASDLRVGAVAPNGKFIGTDSNGTLYDITDDKAVVGEVNVAPQTGALLIGTSPAGEGIGVDRASDGTTLITDYTSTDYNVPPTYLRNGTTSGPYPLRGSETFENIFGLLPDNRVLARERGTCSCEDAATDFPTMKLAAYDLGARTEVPLNAGGMTATTDQVFLTGGGNKAIYGVAAGGGVPAGDTAIVAWSRPSDPPHALPMFYEAFSGGKAMVTPKAASRNGAWLVLSNGEVWYDTEWEQGIQPEGAIEIPDQVKKYAFEQQQYYESQIGYWQTKQKVAVVGLSPMIFSPVTAIALAVGVVGQGVEFSVAVQNRDYWATVSLDPPDPKWKTVASAPKTHVDRLKRPRSMSKKDFNKVTSYFTARLDFLANQICAVDAINRGATALAEDSATKAKAQYAAGARCSNRAAAAAKKSKALASKAAPIVDRSLKKINSLKGGKKTATRSEVKEAVNWQLGQINRLIDIPASVKDEFKELLEKIDAPVRKKKVSSIAKGITGGASHDGGTVKGIGQVGDAFEQAAD